MFKKIIQSYNRTFQLLSLVCINIKSCFICLTIKRTNLNVVLVWGKGINLHEICGSCQQVYGGARVG